MADHHSLQVARFDPQADTLDIIGGASWLTAAERDAEFDLIPEGAEPDDRPQYVVDVLDPDDLIVADREITEHTARRLLGSRFPTNQEGR